jgi:transcription elongation factor Elf1
MLVLMIQDKLEFDVDGIAICKDKISPEVKGFFKRINDYYNKVFDTNYSRNFFWGFNNLNPLIKTIDLSVEAIQRAMAMACKDCDNIYLLDVPKEIALVTDYYSFQDAIYTSRNCNSVDLDLETILQLDNDREQQVLIPYINKSWIIEEITFADLIKKVVLELADKYKGYDAEFYKAPIGKRIKRGIQRMTINVDPRQIIEGDTVLCKLEDLGKLGSDIADKFDLRIYDSIYLYINTEHQVYGGALLSGLHLNFSKLDVNYSDYYINY